MRIALLGAHNAESAGERLAGLLVEGLLALDAGSLTRSLTHAQQCRVRHLFLTHRHYDHVRDVPALAYATPEAGTLHVYGLPDTLEALADHLLNGVLYPPYHRRRGEDGAPRVALHPLEPWRAVTVEELQVLPLPVEHTCPAVGYLVAAGGRSLFYTGDTGPGFAATLARAAVPDLLLAETTYASAARERAAQDGHLTPETLRGEIASLAASRRQPPRTVVLHMNPAHQEAIAQEVATLAAETGWEVALGWAGMALEV